MSFDAQGGNGPADENAMQHVAALVSEVQGSVVLTKFVLITETMDEDDRYIASYTSPGLKEWESLGLLQWIQNQEGAMAAEDDDG